MTMFRTNIEIPKADFQITHDQTIMLFGSCFAENIGQKLLDSKFNVCVNPFGILYNPLSISKALYRLINNEVFTENDLVYFSDTYQSFMHQGKFSNPDKDKCLSAISESFAEAAELIKRMDVMLITFGTAHIFRLKSTNEVVGNCHKFPANYFERERLSVKNIVSEWSELINVLLAVNPDLRIVFTVSPNRYFKDGAHQSQISKATLLLAIEQLQESFSENVNYFPAYEIVLDELRDYRFYARDMIHPSEVAVDYIWQRFSETYFSDGTEKIINEWNPIRRAIEHRPLSENKESHENFLRQTLQKVEQLAEKYPKISFDRDKILLQEKINILQS